MSILHIDGFDHYGTGSTGRGHMLDGAYAQVDSALSPETTNPRTGSSSLHYNGSTSFTEMRWSLPSARTTVGCGGAWYFTTLPTAAQALTLYGFNDASNVANVHIGLDSNGDIVAQLGRYRLGTSTEIGRTASPPIAAGGYYHIEAWVTIASSGSIEVRVNGVAVLTLSGVNTHDSANGAVGNCKQIMLFDTGNPGPITGDTYLDDFFVVDDEGADNNDFIGDNRVFTLMPNGDTPTQDWTPDTGSTGYTQIDDIPPDDDSSYIEAGDAADVSEFTLEDSPSGVAAINAVAVVGKMKKTEAGDAKVLQSIVSGSSIADGDEKALSEDWLYYQDIFEVDPATGAQFTPSGIDSLQTRIERTE